MDMNLGGTFVNLCKENEKLKNHKDVYISLYRSMTQHEQNPILPLIIVGEVSISTNQMLLFLFKEGVANG
jgi:hypothetical protein